MKRSLPLAFTIICFTAFLHGQTRASKPKPTRGWLGVDTIMQDPKWMGTSPSSVFWSEDGKRGIVVIGSLRHEKSESLSA